MKTAQLFITGLLFLAIGISAHASLDQKASAFVLCKNQKNVRTIRITPDEAEKRGCTVTYSKSGVDEIVGGNRSYDACKSVLHSIQLTLEASRWNCRNVGQAHLTYSSDITGKVTR